MLVLMPVEELTAALSLAESAIVADLHYSFSPPEKFDQTSQALLYQSVCEIAGFEKAPYFQWDLVETGIHHIFVIVGDRDEVARKLGQRVEAILPPFTL